MLVLNLYNKNNFKSNIISYTILQFFNMSLLNPDLVLLIFFTCSTLFCVKLSNIKMQNVCLYAKDLSFSIVFLWLCLCAYAHATGMRR